jgi:hypothetical protein
VVKVNIKIKDYLCNEREEMPKWLAEYKLNRRINFKEVLQSRIVFYPGSQFDGQPIKTFNQAHYAHLFVYADYGVGEQRTVAEFNKNHSFKGYHILANFPIKQSDIVSRGWVSHANLSKEEFHWMEGFCAPPFGRMIILERDDEFDETHGSKRFAVLFFGADGAATYDALFGNKYCVPDVLILQDHGFGGNYDRIGFGCDGTMHKVAKTTGVFPKYILKSDNSWIWDGYDELENVHFVLGGQWKNRRYLYIRNQ